MGRLGARRVGGILGCAVLLLSWGPGALGQAPSAGVPSVAAQGAATPVRIGTLGILGDAPFYIAVDRGCFIQQGLAPRLEHFDTGAQMVEPLAAGQLDTGAGTPAASLFNAIGRGLPLRIVADNARVAPGTSHLALVARPDVVADGRLRDYRDLRGRAIGVNARGGGVEIQLDHALARGGLTLGDVDVREVPFPDMLTALANRSLDLAIMNEPFLTLGLVRGEYRVFRPVGDFYPNHQVAVLLYSPQFATQGDAARRFMVAYLQGLRDFDDAFARNQGRAAVVATLTQNTMVRDPSLYAVMAPHRVDRNGQVNRDSLVADLDWYAAHGYLTGDKPDLSAVIDSSFLDDALGVLGAQ